MLGYSTVNQKGQITIPAEIRKKLGIKHGDNVVITQKDKVITVKNSDEEAFWALGGSVKTPPNAPNFKAMRQSFIKYLGTRKA